MDVSGEFESNDSDGGPHRDCLCLATLENSTQTRICSSP